MGSFFTSEQWKDLSSDDFISINFLAKDGYKIFIET